MRRAPKITIERKFSRSEEYPYQVHYRVDAYGETHHFGSADQAETWIDGARRATIALGFSLTITAYPIARAKRGLRMRIPGRRRRAA